MWFLDCVLIHITWTLYDATQPSPDATTGTPGTPTAAIVTATAAVFFLVLLGVVYFRQRSSTNPETGDLPAFADLTEDEHPTWYAAFAPNVSPFELTHPNLWGSFSS
jgi:hypothetical protein